MFCDVKYHNHINVLSFDSRRMMYESNNNCARFEVTYSVPLARIGERYQWVGAIDHESVKMIRK